MFLYRCSGLLEALPEEVVVLRFHVWEHAVVTVAPHEDGRLCPEETLGALPQPAAEDVAPEEGLDLGGELRGFVWGAHGGFSRAGIVVLRVVRFTCRDRGIVALRVVLAVVRVVAVA